MNKDTAPQGAQHPSQAQTNNAQAAPRNTIERSGPLRRISITLTPAGFISCVLSLCVGFVSVFALGIVIGRGHTPEAGIPELARIMPEPAPRSAPTVIDNESLPPAAPHTEAPAQSGIIEQGDLAYPDHLKSREQHQSRSSSSDSAKKKKEAPAAPAPAKKDAPKPVAAKPEAAQSAPAAPGDKSAKTDARAKSADTQIYHYSYQTASFTDKASCDAFTAKLKKAGFTARTEQVDAGGKSWFRVMVDFTGRPDDTDALRDKLKDHGIPKALLRGKTPAQ